MLNDFRFAFRSIARTPVFTAVVVFTLAVGIAGPTAIASRLALGASVSGTLRAIVGENVALALAGIAAGAGGALVFREALLPFLFGVTSTDMLTYVAAGVLLFCVAAGASLVAAMPVLRIDPADTLRTE